MLSSFFFLHISQFVNEIFGEKIIKLYILIRATTIIFGAFASSIQYTQTRTEGFRVNLQVEFFGVENNFASNRNAT
jgi:hypothetical protein